MTETQFGTASYAAAALAFLILTALLSISWRGRPQGARFILAASTSTIWAILLAAHAYFGRVPFLLVYLAELARGGTWLAVLLAIASPATPRLLRAAVPTLLATLLLFGLLLPFLGQIEADADDPALLLSRGSLAIALLGLVLLEHIYRNAGSMARRGLRYLVFGVGGLFAYDLFMGSQAELLRTLGADVWSARGIVNALLVSLIGVAVSRNPQWSLDIFVSRQVVLYSGTFVLVGAYMLLMALGGYYVRVVAGTWGGVAQIIFLAGAGIVLASLVFSGSVRAWIKVFLSKHFYRYKYDYRLEWLRFIQTLSSTEQGDVGRTALRAVAQIFSSPAGILFTVDHSGHRFVPAAAWPFDLDSVAQLEEIRADHDLVRFLSRREWIIDLREYRAAPDVYENIELPAWVDANAAIRIISPLLALSRLVGFIVLYEPPSPFRLTFEDRDLLKTVGRHVATHLAQHEADKQLAESRQFDVYNQLTAFMMHDLKNSVAQLQLLVGNAARHKHNPAFIDDAISTIANTVERMRRLTEQLREKAVSGSARSTDLSALTRGAVARCSARKPVPSLEADATPALVHADPDKLTSVLEHVIRNAQDATPESGSVTVRLRREAATAVIEITDTGCGMDPEFVRGRLFRPFDTTKGSKGMGIGAYQAREYVRMLRGDVQVRSAPGRGTTFSISLPLAEEVVSG